MSVTPLPPVEANKLLEALSQLKRNLPAMIEYNQIDARLKRARFDALVAEGFTPAQAIELCK